MKVSIVTISFNQAAFIEKTIESVVGQNYPDLEYIVVDAGSTDGSREIINRYQDRISKLMLEADYGPADGLNKGFSKASGDIFGFVNSDDMLLPGAITRVVKEFKSNRCLEIVYGNAIKIDELGNTTGAIIPDILSAEKYLHGVLTLAQPSFFFTASAFRDVGGFNKQNKICWDGELFLEFALAGKKAKKINTFFSAFRVYSRSISNSETYIKNYRKEQDRIFYEIKKRERRKKDKMVRLLLLVLKQIEQPYKLWWKIRKPISINE